MTNVSVTDNLPALYESWETLKCLNMLFYWLFTIIAPINPSNNKTVQKHDSYSILSVKTNRIKMRFLCLAWRLYEFITNQWSWWTSQSKSPKCWGYMMKFVEPKLAILVFVHMQGRNFTKHHLFWVFYSFFYFLLAISKIFWIFLLPCLQNWICAYKRFSLGHPLLFPVPTTD